MLAAQRREALSTGIGVTSGQHEHAFIHANLRLIRCCVRAGQAPPGCAGGIIVQRQNPVHHQAGLFERMLRVRRHGLLTPRAHAAFQHFLGQTRGRTGVVRIFLGDQFIRRTSRRRIGNMAGEARALAHERQAGRGELGIFVSKKSPVAKFALQRHEVGVDLFGFGIRHLQIVLQLLFPIEERAVRRRLEGHHRAGVPYVDGLGGRVLRAAGIRDRHRHLMHAGLFDLLLPHRTGLAVAPLVFQGVPI